MMGNDWKQVWDDAPADECGGPFVSRVVVLCVVALLFVGLVTYSAVADMLQEGQPVVGDVVVVYGEAAVSGADEVFPGVWVPALDEMLVIEPAGDDPITVKTLYCNEGPDAPPPTVVRHVVELRPVHVEVERRGRWVVRDDQGEISRHDRLDQAIESATSAEMVGRDCWIVPPERFEVSLEYGPVWLEVAD